MNRNRGQMIADGFRECISANAFWLFALHMDRLPTFSQSPLKRDWSKLGMGDTAKSGFDPISSDKGSESLTSLPIFIIRSSLCTFM